MSNNPPAFPNVPIENIHGELPEINKGMDLRDYFAGQALIGVVTRMSQSDDSEIIARVCYRMADALLEERSK